jgi:hypothetical protein
MSVCQRMAEALSFNDKHNNPQQSKSEAGNSNFKPSQSAVHYCTF